MSPRDLHDLSGRHVVVVLPDRRELHGRVWHVLLTVYGDPTTIILDLPDLSAEDPQDTRVFVPWSSALYIAVKP